MMIEVTHLKSVPLMDVLYQLQATECEDLGVEIPQRGQRIKLPDGRDMIDQRLWTEIIQDQYGNQQFNNDSFYRVPFEVDRDGNLYEDDYTQDMIKLFNFCKANNALNDDGYHAFILFDVCW